MMYCYESSDFNVVSTLDNDNDDSNVTYLCSYCNTKLHYQSTDEQTGKRIFFCLKCNIEYIPANQLVRKASKFETPQGPNKELLTATTDEKPKASSTPYFSADRDLSPLFRALQQRGFT